MQQKFPKEIHKKFKNYFQIKDKESEIEENFYKMTEKYLKYIKWIPGIKMIGIGNSISMNFAKSSSDIDLYIVAKKNRLWLVRILITLIFQIFGIRKNSKKHKARFCLSFFSSLKGMDFSKFAIKNDIYLYFWIIYFKPILDYDNTYNLFLEKNNSWADFSDYKYFFEENKKYIKYKKNTKNEFFLFFNNFLNNFLKKLFLTRTLKKFEKIGKPFGVIVSDNLLKFHNNDIRKNISKKFD